MKINQHRRSFFGLLVVCACCWFDANSIAVAQGLPSSVLDAFTRAGIPPGAVGAQVQELTGTAPALVSLNADVAFSPASVMKLVTTDAALELLGPTFAWKTQAYVTGAQTGDVLQGDLVFRGGGDPKLVVENFWMFLRQIRSRGIRDIGGNVVLDRGVFEDGQYDPARFDGDPLRAYNASPDPLLLNYRAMSLRFVPDQTAGMVRVAVDPPLAGYPVAAPRLAGGECGDWKSATRANYKGNGAIFAGSFSLACGERSWHLHASQMTRDQYFGAVFRQMWRDLGGSLRGNVVSGPVPADGRLIAEWTSPVLTEVIRDINKYSNNVMARQLLLTLATEAYQRPGNEQRGADAIRSWLSAKGIDAPELVVDNGAGLSRNARIAPRTLVRILVAAFSSPVMPEFISSMPLVGVDGTMRQRLRSNGVTGMGHIKTGSLNEVRSIAGYVRAASGKYYAVVSLVNHANAASSQLAHDTLLQWVFANG